MTSLGDVVVTSAFVLPGNSPAWDGRAFSQIEEKSHQWFGSVVSSARDSSAIVVSIGRFSIKVVYVAKIAILNHSETKVTMDTHVRGNMRTALAGPTL